MGAAVLKFVFFLGAVYVCSTKKPKLVIDNDAGGDDAMAIFLALLHERYFDGPELIALTTGNGNTPEDNVYINNQRILKIARRQDIPIYRGFKESLVTTPPTTSYFGIDGLGDSGMLHNDLVPAKNDNAAIKLIELSKLHEGNLTVVTIGTLTNVAMALKLDPDFLNRLAQLYIGAGHIERTPKIRMPNTNMCAKATNEKRCDMDPVTNFILVLREESENHLNPEFNAYMDVESYHIAMQYATPSKVTVFPFSQIYESLPFPTSWRVDVLGSIDTEIIRAQNIFESISIPKEPTWTALDPATVAIAVKPELVKEYKYSKNDIILCGPRRGINTNTFVEEEEANVRIVYSVKDEEYKKFLIDVFSADENK